MAVPSEISMCSWFSYDAKNPLAPGYCQLDLNYLATIPYAKPPSYISQAMTWVAARGLTCADAKDFSKCASLSKYTCFWSSTDCRAGVSRDWSWFTRHIYLDAPAPTWMLCMGSEAYLMKQCSSIGNNATRCNAAAGCTVKGGFCSSKKLAGMTDAQREQWFKQYEAFDPKVHGNCSSVQYLKQVTSVAASTTACKPPATGAKAWCQSKAWCTWTNSISSCGTNLYGPKDSWGTAALAAVGKCTSYTDKAKCTASPKGKLDPKRIQAALALAQVP